MSLYETYAWGLSSADGEFGPLTIRRNTPGDDDVEFDIKFCGVCHSDVHIARDELSAIGMSTRYPCVPGHELAGLVTFAGRNVRKVAVGDKEGVLSLIHI